MKKLEIRTPAQVKVGAPAPSSRGIDVAARKEIVEHAVRWAGNILAEVLHNHGGYIPVEKRDALRRALSELNGAR